MLDIVEIESVQLTFDYSEYSPQLAASLEQHALNMEGFTKRYAASMGKELADAKEEIHAEKQTGWAKWVEGRLGITVQWADKIIRQYERPKSETNFQISPPAAPPKLPESKPSVRYVTDEYSQDFPPEPELDDYQWRYNPETHEAYCKYCYKTHRLWRVFGDVFAWEHVWECEVCEHRTSDEYMQIESKVVDSPEPEEEVIEPTRGVPLALVSSDSNEWYTPSAYIEAARELMGGIDLDPASCEFANETIQAATYYDITQNGLNKPWRGRVWLNPPYGFTNGESNQLIWTDCLIMQFRMQITTEAVLLVNANTEAKWFQPLYNYLICFTDHRIRFYNTSGESSQPTQGNALVYFGHQRERFIELFSKFGTVIARAR